MDNPLIDLKPLSQPITKLIEVLARGAGTLYAPIGTVRQANADAKARVILAKADEEVQSLKARALSRVEYREAVRQENIEAIAEGAAKELPETVSPDEVQPDWIFQFLNNAQDICDSDMQSLWARILAGEVSNPGTYSKRTLEFLKTLEKWEAEKFTELCSCVFTQDGRYFKLLDVNCVRQDILELLGPRAYIDHFIAIGLLVSQASLPSPSSLTGTKLSYFGTDYVLEGPPKRPDGHLPDLDFVAFRDFSLVGNQLAAISGAKPLDGFVERVSRQLKEEHKVTWNKIE